MTEWLRKYVQENPGCRVALAGRTAADVRNTLVTGQSGIVQVSPESEKPVYKMHTSSLEWPNGSTGMLLSSESPDTARGPEFSAGIFDEFAAWKTTLDASGSNLYNNLLAGIRIGQKPKILMATTPKRTEVMRDLIKRSEDPKQNINIIRGSTLENASLSKTFIENLLLQYGDTDLAKQEIEGLMLDDSEGIAFTTQMIDKAKMNAEPPSGLFKIIAVDPSVAADPKKADECGIMVLGVTRESDPRYRVVYLLEDMTIRGTVDEWSQIVADTAKEWGIGDVVAEQNQGGDLIRSVIQARNANLRVHLVTATKGKIKRVEPVALAMQKGRVKFVEDFPSLEDQLLFYDPENKSNSPDRMDAFAWGVTALIINIPKTLQFGTMRAHKVHNTLPSKMPRGKRLILPRRLRT